MSGAPSVAAGKPSAKPSSGPVPTPSYVPTNQPSRQLTQLPTDQYSSSFVGFSGFTCQAGCDAGSPLTGSFNGWSSDTGGVSIMCPICNPDWFGQHPAFGNYTGNYVLLQKRPGDVRLSYTFQGVTPGRSYFVGFWHQNRDIGRGPLSSWTVSLGGTVVYNTLPENYPQYIYSASVVATTTSLTLLYEATIDAYDWRSIWLNGATLMQSAPSGSPVNQPTAKTSTSTPSMAAGKPTAKPSTAIPTYKPSISYGIITTFAGGGGSGDSGVSSTSAYISYPSGVAVDISANVYIACSYSNKIRMVNSAGIITTIAGTGIGGYDGDGGAATSAQLYEPMGAVPDNSNGGSIYIADYGNSKIRMVNSAGIITTFAGTGFIGSSGDGGAATSAQLYHPQGVAVDISGKVYIADNNKIRMVTNTGIITTFAGGGYGGDGVAATSAQLYGPYGVAVDISGNVFIADMYSNKIRMVTSTGSIITTFAGTGTEGSNGDGGAATSAQLYRPYGVSVDNWGNVYIPDNGNHKIRVVTITGIITTFAGTGMWGSSGDGGAATSARLYQPMGVAPDSTGKLLYIVDYGNQKIRVVRRGLPIPSNQPAQVSFALPSPYLSSTWR